MKANEVKDLRSKSQEDLNSQMLGLKKKLFNLRFQAATGALANPLRIRDVKKSIAQIKTILRETELKANN